MFNRKEYKKSALAQLKNRWAVPCLISLIFLALSAVSSPAGGILCAIVMGIISTGFIFVMMAMYTSPEEIRFDVFLQGLERTWLNALFASLWNFLFVFLWSLLFIIPGIVKIYSYSMMPFIIAENPKIGAVQAMDISKIMTRGHKMDLLIMDLSFLGWTILCALTFGIGLIWLVPYRFSAKTNAYYDIKKMAFQSGVLSPADFEVR